MGCVQFSTYRQKLPPKRIFFHNQSVDFVEERREQLDLYLATILVDPILAGALLGCRSQAPKLSKSMAALARINFSANSHQLAQASILTPCNCLS